ncbi:MAG: SIR2 family protein [Tepidisphaeraceae bacterium]
MATSPISTMPFDRFVAQVKRRVESSASPVPAYSLVLGSGFSYPLVPTGKQMIQSDIAWWTYARKNGLRYVEDKTKVHAGLEAHAKELWKDVRDSTSIDDKPAFDLDAKGIPVLTGDGVASAYQAAMSGQSAHGLNSPDQRRDYFRDACTAIGGRINLAHLYLGSILHAQTTEIWRKKKRPFVSTIVTTNFDPLLQRAAQLHNVLYYMTDRPEAAGCTPDDSVDHAVHLIYTHGSIHRHYLANSTSEIGHLADANTQRLTEYFQSHGVIVAGYSGWNDTTFLALQSCQRFDGNLFWCGRRRLQDAINDGDLRQEVIDLLSRDRNSRFYVELGNEGADALMQKLHESLLGDRLPIIVRSPLSLLVDDLSKVEWPTDQENELSSLKGLAEKQLDVLKGFQAQLEQDRQSSSSQVSVTPRADAKARNSANLASIDVSRHMLNAVLAYLGGEMEEAIEGWSHVINSVTATPAQKTEALYNRGVTKGQLTPPDYAGAITDYDAVLAMPEAPAEQKAKALNNRGVAKGQLTPPDYAGAITDYDAVLAMPEALVGQRAAALVNRGVTKGRLTPPDHAGEIADFDAVLAMPEAPAEQKATALYNRGITKGRLTPPDHAGAIADYDAVLAMPEAPAEQKAKALVNRGFRKGQLTPPDHAGAIADFNAVLAMPEAPAEQKAKALVNRGFRKGRLAPPDHAGEIADYDAVLAMPEAPAEQKATALVNRGVTKGRLAAPDHAGAIADFNAVLAMPEAPAEQKAKALVNRGFRKGRLAPPDHAGEIADYDAVLAMPEATAEQKAKALVNRGATKGQLTPPDLAGAIVDFDAVLAMPEAPAEQKAKALVNRGATKGQLTPPDLAGAIIDFDAVLAMPEATAEQKADAHFNLACAAARQGDTTKAVEELHRWWAIATDATQKELDGESDFDPIRPDARFVEFRRALPPG